MIAIEMQFSFNTVSSQAIMINFDRRRTSKSISRHALEIIQWFIEWLLSPLLHYEKSEVIYFDNWSLDRVNIMITKQQYEVPWFSETHSYLETEYFLLKT